jgi:hypothetical protein
VKPVLDRFYTRLGVCWVPCNGVLSVVGTPPLIVHSTQHRPQCLLDCTLPLLSWARTLICALLRSLLVLPSHTHTHTHTHTHAVSRVTQQGNQGWLFHGKVRLVDPLQPCDVGGAREDCLSDPMAPSTLSIKVNNLFPVLPDGEAEESGWCTLCIARTVALVERVCARRWDLVMLPLP